MSLNNLIVNWKGCVKKRQWPSLRYYPGIRQERLARTTKKEERIICFQAEIRTGHLTNTSRKHYRLSYLSRRVTYYPYIRLHCYRDSFTFTFIFTGIRAATCTRDLPKVK
jgi:hypothetical protein